jgi:hypothetical protein
MKNEIKNVPINNAKNASMYILAMRLTIIIAIWTLIETVILIFMNIVLMVETKVNVGNSSA